MAAQTPLRWIRPPRQARSQQTLDRLLDVAEALLEEKGFDDVGVAEIAQRAGSSVGSFYARFPDKAALLHALQERFADEGTATADDALDPARWEGAQIPEIVGAVVAFLVGIHRDRRGLLRALWLAQALRPEFRARATALSLHVSRRLSALLLERREEIAHPDPARAIAFGLWQVIASLRCAVLEPEESLAVRRVSERALPAELTRACLAYLGVRSPDAD
jgi:AcrR family transcriptional regulator